MEITLSQAAERIGKSERTVRRLISDGKIEAHKASGAWVITSLGDEEPPASDGDTPAMVQHLQAEVEYLREENQQLRQELQESRLRSDTIILQLTDQRKMIEDLRQPFWKRWRRRTAKDGEGPAEGA